MSEIKVGNLSDRLFDDCNSSTLKTGANDNWANYPIIFALSLLPVLTISGNILVIVTVLKRRRFHQKTNTFVTSLAVADLSVGLIVMPFAIFLQFHKGEALRSFTLRNEAILCSTANSFDVMFTTTSILHLMCMTIDRYLAISLPLRYCNIMNRRNVTILLIFCWIIPSILSFGFIFGGVHKIGISEDIVKDIEANNCEFTSCIFLHANIEYSLLGSIISFYLPSVFMLFCNIRLFCYVKRRGTRLNELTSNYIRNSHREQQIRTEFKVARTIAILLTCFFICWLPFFLFNVVHPITKLRLKEDLMSFIIWLGYANSAINPYLYYFLNKPRSRPQANGYHGSKEMFINLFHARKQRDSRSRLPGRGHQRRIQTITSST